MFELKPSIRDLAIFLITLLFKRKKPFYLEKSGVPNESDLENILEKSEVL